MPILRTLVGGVLFALGLTQAATAADDAAGFAARLPAKTCLAVFSGDVAQTCEAFQKTRLGATLCGPEFKPLIAELARLERASPMRIRPTFGFDWSDLAGVHDPGGLAIFPLPDGSMGVAWLFVSAEANAAAGACVVAAEGYFKQQGYRSTTVQRTAGTLTLWQPPATRSSDSPRVLFVAKGFYGVANSQGAADALLNVTADQSLAAEASFKKVLPTLSDGTSPGAADVSFFVQPFGLGELVQRSDSSSKDPKLKEQPIAKGKVEKIAKKDQLEMKDKKSKKDKKGKKDKVDASDHDGLAAARRLGWDGLQSLAGRVHFNAAEPCEWQIQATLLAPRPYRGAMRMLELESGPLGDLPSWIPAHCTRVGSWRWDFPRAMKGFGNLFDEANQPGLDGEGLFEDMLDGLRDDAEGVQVDLRRDVFAHLGPNVLRVTGGGQPGTDEESRDRPWLIILGVRDTKAVLDALTRFYKGDKRVQHANSGKYDVWTSGEGASLFVEGESDSVVNVRALAIGQGQLLFSTDIDLLNLAIHPQPGGPTLPNDPAWTRLLDWLKRQESERTAVRSLMRLDGFLEPSYQSATTKASDDAEDPVAGLWRLLLFGTTEASAGLPYSAAPKFDSLRAGLPPSAWIMSQTDDGWSIHFGAQRPLPSTTP